MTKRLKLVLLTGDIHSNLPALKAVLADAGSKGFEGVCDGCAMQDGEVWNLGDSVGYCTFPNEVLDLLREAGAVSISGNYDLKVLDFEKNRVKWAKKKSAVKFRSFQWTYEHLSDENKAYLAGLPEQVRMEVEGVRVLMVHGSPASNSEYICPETTKLRLEELAEMARADVVLSGHSHKVFTTEVKGVMFVNPGSVGRPEGTDGKACYAILRFKEGKVTVENYEVEYDIEQTVQGIVDEGLPAEYVEMLKQGKNLGQIESGSDDPDQKQRDEQLESVKEFAERFGGGDVHSRQVTKLALRLFDELKNHIGMGHAERFYLECGAVLHDIGWIKGRSSHHKVALKMIVKDRTLPFDRHEKVMIGLMARYHRKAMPKLKHPYYCDLTVEDKNTVSVLGGVLRIADGLDRSHLGLVKDVSVVIEQGEIIIGLEAIGSVADEIRAAMKKSDLLEKMLQKKIVFRYDGL